ncbi:MAG TPA: HAMP domain-containing sensor histidine kinase [Kofleriaceae bacterium]|nr:HAMP domain-containing sensor histidine kinase [Kofleriaceae bacterium]
MRARRAWVYVLTIAALIVPAAGIAYLGAVSYRNERGAVSAQNERQRQAALGIASRISRAIDEAFDATERAVATGTRGVAAPLARYWFWIDAEQHLRVPQYALPTVELGGGLERGAGCAGGRLEDCVHELSTRRSRIARLSAAQRAEAGANWPEARRQYAALATFADTGPMALLGLARVLGHLEDVRARDALVELEQRFGDRSFEGIPVRLVVAILGAGALAPDAKAEALLGVADGVLAGRYTLAPVVQLGVLAHVRSHLPSPGTAAQARRLAQLDAQILELRTQARAADGLADDLPEIMRSATPAWRGRAATRAPARTLIYRRRADGGVIGFAVDAPILEAAAGSVPEVGAARVALRARPLVVLPGTSPGPELRMIQQVPLGAALPHLSVAIVNPLADPDPLDEVIGERSRRHVMYTSALAIALGLGLLATIRGAARARELAQLKSDFVSTVSHELKTPLTSIRMFAEMLEQGVAQGDPEKLARYHGVIVQESQRLGLLIANLLDWAQIEKGIRRYAQTHQGIAALAHHAATTFETLHDPQSGGRNPLAVAVSSEAMHAEVEVDRDVVVGAVLNLLANAAKYGGAAHPIEVQVGADGRAAWIAVRDHGPGIPPVEQARIFREFYRAPEAYRSGVEGTGLGLALVKRHIEALGGTVEVASVVGEGATFTIRLPRAAGGQELG